MPLSPKEGSTDPLDHLLSAATHHSAGAGFSDRVIDAVHTEPQGNSSPRIIRFLAPTLAAAAGVVITLLVTGEKSGQETITAEEIVMEDASDAEVIITELDSIDTLLALEFSTDVFLVEDEELDALLF
ncbi:hypothetical protein OAF27_01455 [Verrucomicrobiales bacterium]|nr:hypothetical protein [Verrucomicrobiales bacterium]